VAANVTFGFAPNDIRSWWSNNACNTTPNTSTDLCRKSVQGLLVRLQQRIELRWRDHHEGDSD
jgi:hypothetical protein